MSVLTGLSPAKISQLSAAQIKTLSASDIAGMTSGQLAGLTATQLALFNGAQLGAFSQKQVGYLATAALGGLTNTQMAVLTSAQMAGFTVNQIASFTPSQFAAITATGLSGLSVNQIKALTKAQVAALTAAQMPGLSAADIAALTPAEIASLSTGDIAALSSTQLKALTTQQLQALTTTQIGALSTTQVGALTPGQRASFSAKQLAALPGAQAPAQPTPDTNAMTPAQLTGLTPAQIAGLTAAQINALSAAQLAGLNINYGTMLGILQADANGGMTATEFGALNALVGKFNAKGGIAVSGYVQQIADDVVLGNNANATWTGGKSYASGLGNLNAASTQSQVNELIGKWFLGTDLPNSMVFMNGAPSFTVSYAPVSAPLFGANGPVMTDVNQGYLGDCFVMAPLAEMAWQDPSDIQSMITANGNNTYSVCFTIDGKADYVTVDNELPNGGNIFNHAGNDWASLIEKAYVQLQAGGNVSGANASYGNSWSSIASGGTPERTLAEFTGADTIIDYVANATTWTSYNYNGDDLTVTNAGNSFKVQSSAAKLSLDTVQAALIADLAAGDDVILSSNTNALDAGGKLTLMANHSMAVFGFDSATNMFEVYNPWGKETGQTWDTTFEVSLSTLLAAGDTLSVAVTGTGTGAATPSLLAAPPHTSAFGLATAT